MNTVESQPLNLSKSPVMHVVELAVMFPGNSFIWCRSRTMKEILKGMEVRLSDRIGAGAGAGPSLNHGGWDERRKSCRGSRWVEKYK